MAVSWTRSKCVGKGSFGTVSLGVNKSDGRTFAVKSVEQSMELSPQIQSLENEIRILRSLRSPYVVGFIGDDVSYETPTTSYRNMHMEFLPGGTVADSVAGGAYSDEKLLRSRIWCVVSALSYIHSRGVVHCDVKGRNILITQNPSFVKLADFGSAVELSGDGVAGTVVPRGTPLWMAPEVVRGESQGPESDVWSLGCTVIEMITGKSAWVDFGVETLSRIGYTDELPEIPSQLSEIGRDFLEKCLRRDPSQRWSCDQLLQHPYLASASPITAVESSPRCVLDWVDADSDSDDNFEENWFRTTHESDDQIDEIPVKNRVGKLITSRGENWESDGWFPVRSFAGEAEASASASRRCFCGDDEERTRPEYTNLNEAETEMEGMSLEYSEFSEDNYGRMSTTYSNHGGIEFQERAHNYSNSEFKCGGGGGGGEEPKPESNHHSRSEKREITLMTLFGSCKHSIELILYQWKVLIELSILFLNYTLLLLFFYQTMSITLKVVFFRHK